MPVDSYKTDEVQRLEMAFPHGAHTLIRLYERIHAVWICLTPDCVDFAVQRVLE